METIKKNRSQQQSFSGVSKMQVLSTSKESFSNEGNPTENIKTDRKSLDERLDLLFEKLKQLVLSSTKSISNLSLTSNTSNSSDSAIVSDQGTDSTCSSQIEEKESSGIDDSQEQEDEDEDKVEDEVYTYDECPYFNQPWNEIKQTVPGFQENGRFRLSKIEHYSIPREYKNLLKNNLDFTPRLNAAELELLKKLISKYEPDRKGSNKDVFEYTAVGRYNYQEFFHDLLWFEEQEQIYRMANYNMFGVRMFVKPNGKETTLYVPGLAEKRPSILKKDIILVRFHHEPTVQYSGFVKEVRDEVIIIKGFDMLFLNRLSTAQLLAKPLLVDVRFTPTRYPFFVQHRAFDLLKENTFNKLFPDEKICGNWPNLIINQELEKIEFINPDVGENEEQKQAVFSILKGTSLPAPYIIFGPPGTGKTVTFVEAILQVKNNFPGSHILVCAQGNSACDHIAIKLLQSGACEKTEILRLNSSARMEDIPKEIFSISKSCPKKHIRSTKEFRIIVCTLVTAGRFIEASVSRIQKKLYYQSHTFTHLFIDEAGQASEPEALVAISGLLKASFRGEANGQLVLAGDPKQLGPVCNGLKARKFGLGVSLMERLMAFNPIYQIKGNGEYDGRFITQLVRNFRSHEDILEVSNKLFYNNKLLPQGVEDELCSVSLIANPKVKGSAVIFHGVLGTEQKEERSPSIYNNDEILVVVDYIKKLFSCDITNKIKPEEIGVVAPYALQVHKLREEIRRHIGWSNIQVGSTEVFQGREKRAVIVSTVRSQSRKRGFDKKFNLGFVREPKRFNVIMTRAQSKLIVVGNPEVLIQDKCWRLLIEKAIQSNSYRGCSFRL